MKEEIMYGIKSAMERGSSLEQAGQSFINAGYNEKEVKEAIGMLSSNIGVTEIISGKMPDASDFEKKDLPEIPPVKKKRGKWVLILIVLLTVLILGVLGVMVYYLIK